ncbi:hypothetical protein FRC14_003511, partial [Serendipita sp. 396]
EWGCTDYTKKSRGATVQEAIFGFVPILNLPWKAGTEAAITNKLPLSGVGYSPLLSISTYFFGHRARKEVPGRDGDQEEMQPTKQKNRQIATCFHVASSYLML